MAFTEDIGNVPKVSFIVLDRCQPAAPVVATNGTCTGISLKACEAENETVKFWSGDKTPLRGLAM
jgi:hypothetical protein